MRRQGRRSGRTEQRVAVLVIALLGFVPVGAGLAGVLAGASMTGLAFDAGSPSDAALDSHVRYLSGLLLGIGIAFWSTLPRLADRGRRFRLLTVIVVAGGLGRLGGVVAHGWPPPSMRFGLAMELVVTPLLCLWQWRLARGRSFR